MVVKKDRNNSDENMKLNKHNNGAADDSEDLSGVKKVFSRRRAFIRIILGFVALILWFLIGVSPTIIFSSSMQEFIGVFSFFVKNPILFLLVAFLNIISGVIVYIYFGIWLWAAFHLIWSIRWFYGYFLYRSTTLRDVINDIEKKQLN